MSYRYATDAVTLGVHFSEVIITDDYEGLVGAFAEEGAWTLWTDAINRCRMLMTAACPSSRAWWVHMC